MTKDTALRKSIHVFEGLRRMLSVSENGLTPDKGCKDTFGAIDETVQVLKKMLQEMQGVKVMEKELKEGFQKHLMKWQEDIITNGLPERLDFKEVKITDRQKIAKVLSCCIRSSNGTKDTVCDNDADCDSCPIHYTDGRVCCREFEESVSSVPTGIIRAAISMLKEQEPVQAELEGGGSTWWIVCGECRGPIDTNDHYCKHCGKKVKWS